MKRVDGVLSGDASVFLNLVRLAACEMVVFGHFLTKYQPVPYDTLFVFGSTLGGAAVLIFFALSGLLVSYSLLHKLEDHRYGFRSFFIDRFSRIYSGLVPALLLSAVITALIYYLNVGYFNSLSTMQSAPSPLTFTMTLLMLERFPVGLFNGALSNLGVSFPLPEVTPFGFNGILWTLVVEWWIYMFFGALVIGSLALAGKRKKCWGYKAVLCLAIVLFGLLLAGFCGEFGGLIAVWFAGALMMVALGSGALGKMFSGGKSRVVAWMLLAACLLAAVFAFYLTYKSASDFYNAYLGFALSACLLLAVMILNKPKPNLSGASTQNRAAKFAAFGADYSFTLFLTHYPIIIFINGLNLPVDRWAMLLPIMLVTNAVACAVAFFTEGKSKQLATAIKKIIKVP